MTNRPLLALVLAATMVLAGCSGGTGAGPTAPVDDATDAEATVATSTERADTTTGADYPAVKTEDCEHRGEADDDIVNESGACLPFDSDAVYERVVEMAGVDIDEGPTVNSIPARETRRFEFEFNDDSFGATMGIAPDGTPNVFSPGYAQPGANGGDPAVTLRYVGYWNDTALQDELGIDYSARDAEVTAAHEFLHVIQFYRGSQQRLLRNLTREGVNREDVRLATIEGSASFFEAEYQREYLDVANPERNLSEWANATPFSMALLGPYVLGEHYTRWYLDNATGDFERLYDDPPVSMEQIIHGYPPDEELPKNLSVRGEASSDWSSPSSPRTKGELFLRSALRSGVSGAEAAAGAAGWGQDGAIAFRNASSSAAGDYERGYGWAIRFDNATEADEFTSIFQAWLESKGPEENGVYVQADGQTFRMVEVSDETVVVLAGSEAFTRQATVSGNPTEVVIEHTGEDQTRSVADDESVVAASGHARPLA